MKGSFPHAALAALLLALLSPGQVADAAELHRCVDAAGGVTFTDHGCRGIDHPRQAQRLVVEARNFIEGGALTEADRAQLQRIDARSDTGAGVVAVGTSEEPEACRRARARLDAHRARARQPHARSMIDEGRERRAAVRAACH